MIYSILADITVVLHFLWILFLVFGAFPGRRYKWIKVIHIGGVIYALVIQVFGWYCPLTHLEAWLRRMHAVTSRWIGERVLDELVVLDTLAAARFASVFHNFENADDYARFFSAIENGKGSE